MGVRVHVCVDLLTGSPRELPKLLKLFVFERGSRFVCTGLQKHQKEPSGAQAHARAASPAAGRGACPPQLDGPLTFVGCLKITNPGRTSSTAPRRPRQGEAGEDIPWNR